MPRILIQEDALRILVSIQAGAPIGGLGNAITPLWRPQDAAFPKGKWIQTDVKSVNLPYYLAKGYRATPPEGVKTEGRLFKAEEAGVEAPAPPPMPFAPSYEFSKLMVGDLRRIAKANGISLGKNKTKAAIIAVLEAAALQIDA